MNIADLKADLEKGDFLYKGSCHDCGIPVFVDAHVTEDGEIHVSGGAVYKIPVGPENKYFFKCESCFKQDKTLHNWQECEVYSRVVGYLRPVNQYNLGKKEEFKMRKEFTTTEGL